MNQVYCVAYEQNVIVYIFLTRSFVLMQWPVLSIVAGWRESGGLGHLCGGENFWGRVEKSKIFTFFCEHQRYLQKIQLLHFKISKIVAVWPKIEVVFW